MSFVSCSSENKRCILCTLALYGIQYNKYGLLKRTMTRFIVCKSPTTGWWNIESSGNTVSGDSSIGSNIGHGRCLGRCCNRTFKVTDCKQRTRKLFRFSVSDSVGIDVQLNCSLAPWQVPLFRLACLNPWIYKQTICQGVDWRHFLGRPHNWWLEPSTPGHRNISSVLWQWDLSDTTVLASYMTRWWWTKGPSIS